ncbi:MAG: transglycosylase domain-containing protein, partial [Acidobacteriota bacterium]
MNRRRTRIALRWAAVLAGLSLASCALLAGYGVALVDRAMTERGQPRSVPLLAAPLTLRDGDPWTEADLRAALLRRGFPPAPGAEVGAGEFGAAAGEITIGPGLVQGATRAVAVEFGASGIGIRTAAHGRVAAITLRASVAGTTAPGSVVAWPVSLTDISPGLITAIVDLEDRGFLSHAGLSLRGVVRAAWHDLVSGRVREGGSTITQQLAKLLLLRPDRRLSRKLLEAWLATLLEYRYDKRTILEAYLNRVYLGQDGGWQIQGVEAASHYYFGKRARDLELAESALLAGLVAAPNLFDPFTHRDQALSRRRTALQAMVREGHLGVAAAEAIGASALPAAARRFRWPPAAHYADWVHGTRTGRGSVASALDPDVQDAVRAGCDAGLRVLEARSARLRELRDTGDPIQVAVVVMAPDGRVVALTGSRRGLPGEFDRATEARRQIGSLVKPFVVAAAVERGWSLEATLADTPLSLVDGGRGWTPANSDGR